jgi:hypothetical protein
MKCSEAWKNDGEIFQGLESSHGWTRMKHGRTGLNEGYPASVFICGNFLFEKRSAT